MDYWGKLTSAVNNVTGTASVNELNVELKKREKMLK